MTEYYFLYKDSLGRWKEAQNPIFIASHQHCRAIPKEIVNDVLGYCFISDLVFELHNAELPHKELSVLAEFDIIV